MHDRLDRLIVALRFAALTLAGAVAWSAGIHPSAANPFSVVFQVDGAASNLELTSTLIGFNETTSRLLGGSLAAMVDFGESGMPGSMVQLSFSGGDISTVADFEFDLTFNAVAISSPLAEIVTDSPSATGARQSGPDVVYEFDAAEFAYWMNRGVLMSGGIASASIDLSDEPIGGRPSSSLASLSLEETASAGPLATFDAVLSLPLEVSTVIDLGGNEITIVGSGNLRALATFSIPVPTISADFDEDLDVDGDDLTKWEMGFGMSPAAHIDGDADGNSRVDGADFLLWQRAFGLAPPLAATGFVPEPSGFRIVLVVALLLGRHGAMNKKRRSELPVRA